MHRMSYKLNASRISTLTSVVVASVELFYSKALANV
jgi:hypothetical protein